MDARFLQEFGLIHAVSGGYSVAYTSSMTQDLDIQRLLVGKRDYWRMPKMQQRFEKKKLIIAENVSELITDTDELLEFKKFWSMMLDHGFELYAWTGELKLIKNRDDLNHVLSDIRNISPSELSTALIEKNLPRDDAFIATKVWRELLNKSFNRYYQDSVDSSTAKYQDDNIELSIDAIAELLMNDHMEKVSLVLRFDDLYELLNKNHPQHAIFEKFIQYGGSIALCELSHMDISKIPNHVLERINKISGIVNMSADKFAEVARACPNLRNLSVEFNTKMSGKEFAEIVNQCQNLVQFDSRLLHATGDANVHKEFIKYLNATSLSQLSYMNLEGWGIDTDDLSKLVNKAKELRYLLFDVDKIGEEILYQIDPNILMRLVVLPAAIMQSEHMEKLIQLCPNLAINQFDTISLNVAQIQSLLERPSATELTIVFEQTSLNFNNLKNIPLCKMMAQNISGEILASIIKASPQLSSLHLEEPVLTGLAKHLSTNNALPYLTELHLNSVNDGVELISLLNQCPHLIDFEMNVDGQMKDIFISNQNELLFSQLLRMCIKQPTDVPGLTSHDFAQLMHHASQLIELQLSIGSADEWDQQEDMSYFSTLHTNNSLRNLMLDGFYINDDLVVLVQKFPMLDTLEINDCFMQWDTKRIPDDFVLQHLTKLKIDNSNISNAYLAKILNRCPSLITLNVNADEIDAGLLSLLTPPTYERLLKYNSEFVSQLQSIQSQINSSNSNTNISDSKIDTNDLPGHTLKKTRAIDAPDVIGEKTLKSKQVFYLKSGTSYPIEAFYRVHVFNNAIINDNEVLLCVSGETHLPYVKTKFYTKEDIDLFYKAHESEPDLYFGKMIMTFDSYNPQPLVGLSRADELIGLATLPHADFDITYNVEENLYYIKPKNLDNCHTYSISYLLSANKPMYVEVNDAKDAVIDANDIQALTQICFSSDGSVNQAEAIKRIKSYTQDQRIELLMAFTSGFEDELLNSDVKNGLDILNSVIKERKGVCRHRAIIFKMLATVLDVKDVNIVESDTHAFVEVKHGDQWVTHNLGGRLSNIQHESLNPMSQPEAIVTSNATLQEAKRVPHSMPADPVPDSAMLDNPYRTWDTLPTLAKNYYEYAEELLLACDSLPEGSQNILSIIDKNAMEFLHHALHKKINENHRSVYYINDLDDIGENTFKIDNQSGEYTMIDSPLFQFVKGAKSGDVLIINWSNFQSRHIGCNTITDAVRMLNGIAIPSGVRIISLLPSHQIMGEDFYSRQNIKSRCSSKLAAPVSLLPMSIATLTEEQKKLPIIDCYGNDWEYELKGQLRIHGEHYQFVKSAFITALEQHKNGIVLHNAPWQNVEFRLFITEMMTSRKIFVNGIYYQIPDKFKIIRYDQPYSLSLTKYSIQTHDKNKNMGSYHVVNNYTMNHLFKRYACQDKMIDEKSGLLEQFHGKTIPLFITETLSKEQWARIIAEAAKYDTRLEIVISPHVDMPAEMWQHQSNEIKSINQEAYSTYTSTVLITNDLQFLMSNTKEQCVIAIDESTTYADLIESILVEDSQGKKAFTHQKGVLADYLLNNNGTVILKGRISPMLAKQLESLFSPDPYFILNGERFYLKNTVLLFLTDQSPAMEAYERVVYNYDDKKYWQALQVEFPNECEKLQKVCEKYTNITNEQPFSYVELRTMLKHMKKFPNSNPLKQILRLNKNYSENKEKIEAAWRTYHTKEKVLSEEPVMTKRKNKLLAYLDESPYVFIAGPSGVGKTTFIQTELSQTYGDDLALFTGMDKIQQWVASNKKHKILFIDEANLLAPGSLDRFETLFEKPPKILMNGKLVQLSDDHKVIFAGNFGHYQGRHRHRLFAEHGSTITFKELPYSFLKNNIIKPVAEKLGVTNYADVFIAAYQFVNELYPDKHPVTARNLQMMALRCYKINQNLNNPEAAAALAIFDELRSMMNKNQEVELKKWIASQFNAVDIKKVKKHLNDNTHFSSDKYFMTKHRKNPIRIMNDLFDLRDIKISKIPQLQGAGTNGLLFESEAGEGKTRMATEFLKARKIQPADPAKQNNQNHYYHLSVTDPKMIKQQLTKAFHEGAVIVIDEINTLPDIEETLNALLSGRDLEGQPAKHPGFFIIGTQNPITYSKRQPLSPALSNRFQKIDLKPYSNDELFEIKTKLVNDTEKAKNDLQAFITARQYANERELTPAPTPRDFFARR